jgi:glycosyltransferase involved in cell wall biosynthesis
MPIKVCHFTSGHDSFDSRVFEKQCRTLSDKGYEVHLVTPVGENERRLGVNVVSAGIESYGRFKRMLLVSRLVYKKALSIDADIYHFHDPELIPFGLKLKKLGKKVIYDSHEDTPSDILNKHWIPKFMRPIVSKYYQWYEASAAKKFDGVVSVTPHVVDRLKSHNTNTYLITNYPILRNLPLSKQEITEETDKTICFVGRISDESIQSNIVKALNRVKDAKYILAGPADPKFIHELSKIQGWEYCNYEGSIKFSESPQFFSKAIAGMQLTDYIPNFGYKLGSLGNTKLFAYMSAGLPIICTDLVLWKEIMDTYDCGICVNPHDIDQISSAIRYIIDDPQRARKMGENGRRAVLEKYNWSSQIPSLLALYKSLS